MTGARFARARRLLNKSVEYASAFNGPLVLHVYCVRFPDDAAPDPGLLGVDGLPVRAVRGEGLGFWVSEGPLTMGTPVERLREHDLVVRSALRSATPLPVRFGTRFRDVAAMEAAFRPRIPELREQLERVRDSVEMGVRISWNGAEQREAAGALVRSQTRSSPTAGPGRRYLEQRRAEARVEEVLRARASEILEGIESHFRQMQLPVVRTLLPEPNTAATLAHLVHRREVGSYRQAALRARENLREVAVSFSGPWAPYSFAAPADAGGA